MFFGLMMMMIVIKDQTHTELPSYSKNKFCLVRWISIRQYLSKAHGPHVVWHTRRQFCYFISLPVNQSLPPEIACITQCNMLIKGLQNKSSSWISRRSSYLSEHNGRAWFCSYRFVAFTTQKSGSGTRESKFGTQRLSPYLLLNI